MGHPAHEMAGSTPDFKPRRYDSDELVRMRSGLPFVCCYVAKLNKHSDIGKYKTSLQICLERYMLTTPQLRS